MPQLLTVEIQQLNYACCRISLVWDLLGLALQCAYGCYSNNDHGSLVQQRLSPITLLRNFDSCLISFGAVSRTLLEMSNVS